MGLAFTSYSSTKGNIAKFFNTVRLNYKAAALNPATPERHLARMQSMLHHTFNAIGGHNKVQAANASTAQKHFETMKGLDNIAIQNA